MICELPCNIQQQVNRILETDSSKIGHRYWRSNEKRLLELAFALPGGVLASPAIGAGALAVFAADRHNPFVNVGTFSPYTNQKEPFDKLRTMIPDAWKYEAEVRRGRSIDEMKKDNDDWRITRVGRVLRRTRMDELPQLWSILRSKEVALVGPRQFSASEFRDDFMPFINEEPYSGLYRMMCMGLRRGVIGFYNLFYDGQNSNMRERVELERQFGERDNLKADLRVIYQTIKHLKQGK
jgi:lipopolysaccharide/colanic/teichoic acid biosynthesis glycosyltransferase